MKRKLHPVNLKNRPSFRHCDSAGHVDDYYLLSDSCPTVQLITLVTISLHRTEAGIHSSRFVSAVFAKLMPSTHYLGFLCLLPLRYLLLDFQRNHPWTRSAGRSP